MRSEKSLIEKIEADFLNSARESFWDFYEDLAGRCESPIERVFLAALIARLDVFNFNYCRDDKPFVSIEQNGCLSVQSTIGPYRTDFLITLYDRGRAFGRIVLECDGHDFHEKTKLQARRDKSRDRFLQTNECMVLRFAGSEIWADADECAGQVIDAVGNSFERHYNTYKSK